MAAAPRVPDRGDPYQGDQHRRLHPRDSPVLVPGTSNYSNHASNRQLYPRDSPIQAPGTSDYGNPSSSSDVAQGAAVEYDWITVVPLKPWQKIRGGAPIQGLTQRPEHGSSLTLIGSAGQSKKGFASHLQHPMKNSDGLPMESGARHHKGSTQQQILKNSDGLRLQNPPSWNFKYGSKATSWKDICVMRKEIDVDCALHFYPPLQDNQGKLYASVLRSEILDNINKWPNTLVGYVLGVKLFYSHIKGCVGRTWRPTCSLEVHSKENGYFFFKFCTKEECDRILHDGPWLFDGRLIILKPWSEFIGLERDLLSSVPVWIRLPNLHLKFWSKKIISLIASVIGVPLYMDTAAALGERLSFARCFVEISAVNKLPRSVTLDLGNGDIVETPVQYEWIPPRCGKCFNFGHIDSQCPAILVEKWVPTGKIIGQENNGKDVEENADTMIPTDTTDTLNVISQNKNNIQLDSSILHGVDEGTNGSARQHGNLGDSEGAASYYWEEFDIIQEEVTIANPHILNEKPGPLMVAAKIVADNSVGAKFDANNFGSVPSIGANTTIGDTFSVGSGHSIGSAISIDAATNVGATMSMGEENSITAMAKPVGDDPVVFKYSTLAKPDMLKTVNSAATVTKPVSHQIGNVKSSTVVAGSEGVSDFSNADNVAAIAKSGVSDILNADSVAVFAMTGEFIKVSESDASIENVMKAAISIHNVVTTDAVMSAKPANAMPNVHNAATKAVDTAANSSVFVAAMDTPDTSAIYVDTAANSSVSVAANSSVSVTKAIYVSTASASYSSAAASIDHSADTLAEVVIRDGPLLEEVFIDDRVELSDLFDRLAKPACAKQVEDQYGNCDAANTTQSMIAIDTADNIEDVEIDMGEDTVSLTELNFPLVQDNPEWLLLKENSTANKKSSIKHIVEQRKVPSSGPKRTTRVTRAKSTGV